MPRTRARVRQISRRPRADDQRAPSARLGVAQLQSRAVRALEPRQHRADGRRAATAHFSIGSGTKLALESAIALADDCSHSEPTLRAGLRRVRNATGALEVLKLQSAARNSTEWFEDVERYLASRSRPVQLFAADPLAAHQSREPASARSEMARRRRDLVRDQAQRGPSRRRRARRCSCHSRCARWNSTNRVVVSPMAQYKAVDGMPGDWHLVHYGERAKGGAGLVITEMTCVSPEARITPGCTGLYARAHGRVEAHRRFRARRDVGENLPATRPLRRQGLDAGRLGGDGRAAARPATGR